MADGGASVEKVAEQIANDGISTGTALSLSRSVPPTVRKIPHAASLCDLQRVARRDFGRPILASKTANELRWRLDWAIKHPDFSILTRLGTERVTHDLLRYVGRDQSTEYDRAVFGDATKTIDEALRLRGAMVDLQPMHAHSNADGLAQERAIENPFGFATDPDLPPPMARLMLRIFRASPAVFALAEARHAGEVIDPWLVRALADRWIDGQRAILVLLASIPENNVSPEVVPLADRIDLDRLDRIAKVYRRRNRESLRRAAAKGFPSAIAPST